MDSDHDHDRGHCHYANHRSLEPHLAILQVEPHVGQITNKVWLIGNFLAEASPDRGVGRGSIRSRDSSKNDKEKIGDGIVAAEPDKGREVLDDADETDQGRDRLGGEITGEKTPKESETLATPRVEGTLPFGLWLDTLENAPEGIKLEGEEEVENGPGERYEESDRSSGTG